ncbi:hypothetical protein EVAR_19433_1 [Eumeta japonica]|uniref:Uncharacterized protein n=1 Tax=Eumeta variegata TaxID=151549 RepID=A0A4C1TRN1_EUMVA|nr:hypothetical protein EVAR_19433_1 [Eumeta japonica]
MPVNKESEIVNLTRPTTKKARVSAGRAFSGTEKALRRCAAGAFTATRPITPLERGVSRCHDIAFRARAPTRTALSDDNGQTRAPGAYAAMHKCTHRKLAKARSGVNQNAVGCTRALPTTERP